MPNMHKNNKRDVSGGGDDSRAEGCTSLVHRACNEIGWPSERVAFGETRRLPSTGCIGAGFSPRAAVCSSSSSELLAVLLPICPNCGKSFRILKTSLKNGPQFCPYCTQPFSVQDDKFVRESASFSSGRTPTNAQQAFNELFNRGSNAKAPSSSGTIVDVEAEVTDIE